jgi:hypothetical protein
MSQFPVTITVSGIAVTTANDLMQFTVASNRPVTVCGLSVVQSSDVGDAQDEVLRVGFYRGVTAGTTGGSAGTAAAMQQGGPTPGVGSANANWTNPSTGGTLVAINGFNIRAGLEWWFPELLRPYCTNAAAIQSFRLLAAPADSLTLDVCVYLMEG